MRWPGTLGHPLEHRDRVRFALDQFANRLRDVDKTLGEPFLVADEVIHRHRAEPSGRMREQPVQADLFGQIHPRGLEARAPRGKPNPAAKSGARTFQSAAMFGSSTVPAFQWLLGLLNWCGLESPRSGSK